MRTVSLPYTGQQKKQVQYCFANRLDANGTVAIAVVIAVVQLFRILEK